ncbi:MAG: c-type cytochrome biogenesis protein CcmI, partial [Achromobacter sp.]|nr:c-type cytochrome biogenesis protein CcmI [Achromobacter sp.]
MTTLWLAFLFLLLAALLCLVAPLLRKNAAAAMDAGEDGLRDFYLARREQLRLDAAGGAPDLAAEEELQRELLHDLALRRSAQPALGRPGGQRAALATACLLSVAVPLAAAALYGKLGNPRAAASAAQVAAP